MIKTFGAHQTIKHDGHHGHMRIQTVREAEAMRR